MVPFRIRKDNSVHCAINRSRSLKIVTVDLVNHIFSFLPTSLWHFVVQFSVRNKLRDREREDILVVISASSGATASTKSHQLANCAPFAFRHDTTRQCTR